MMKTASFALILGAFGLAGCQETQGQNSDVELEEQNPAQSGDGAIDGIVEPNTPNRAIANRSGGTVENQVTDEDEAGIAGEVYGEDTPDR